MNKRSNESTRSLLNEHTELSLQRILTDSILLHSFELYLTHDWSHENLLFIEAVNQLRHDTNNTSKDIEDMFFRIYNTFIAVGAPFEINIKSQEQIEQKIRTTQWIIITRNEALEILKDAEEEVLAILGNKLEDFLRTSFATTSSKQSKVHSEPISSLQRRVVIIGGGFTGFTVASILDPMPLFHVTLIDTKDSFEYTPHIVTKLVSPEKSSSLRFSHSSYIKNGKIIIGYVEDVCEDAKCVKINGEKIYCDYLVLATGSSYANQLKSTDSSSLYRTTGLNNIANKIKNSHKILIIGAGLVGCELAAAIAEKKFDSVYPKKKVTLVEAKDRIIYRADEKQRKKAEKFLMGLGVKIIVNERIITHVSEGGQQGYYDASGNFYSSDEYTIFLATGVKVNTSFIENSTNDPPLDTCLDKNGLIRVRPTLQVDHWKYNHIFAGGDATNIIEEKTAYAATIAGVCIARNICRIEKGKEPIAQGNKGLLAPPRNTLHGIKSHGGIGKKSLSYIERKLAFLNPTWQVLKYFNEKQFLKIVQETSKNSKIIGRLPKVLSIPMEQDQSTIINSRLHSQQVHWYPKKVTLSYKSDHSVRPTGNDNTDDRKQQYIKDNSNSTAAY
ncbi:MAG: hypothetical protein EXX96DRAFT_546841 [Benjaminiella poitrasii]|nr:MAG: hypothetical protein EXX96DRAFT_546841 [Benjaminiella poitrasii]